MQSVLHLGFPTVGRSQGILSQAILPNNPQIPTSSGNSTISSRFCHTGVAGFIDLPLESGRGGLCLQMEVCLPPTGGEEFVFLPINSSTQPRLILSTEQSPRFPWSASYMLDRQELVGAAGQGRYRDGVSTLVTDCS